MNLHGSANGTRGTTRRELVRQYVQLQRELIDGDPSSSAYQATIHAFRQLGYTLIASGYEDDLDRLLRLRVIEGALVPRCDRGPAPLPDLHVIEQVPSTR